MIPHPLVHFFIRVGIQMVIFGAQTRKANPCIGVYPSHGAFLRTTMIAMTTADWVGFLGVFLILLAYLLNVTGRVSAKDRSFILLNLIGAGLACLASVFIGYWPFILLEGVWALVSLGALITNFRTKGS